MSLADKCKNHMFQRLFFILLDCCMQSDRKVLVGMLGNTSNIRHPFGAKSSISIFTLIM
jgi:hypothetical protein